MQWSEPLFALPRILQWIVIYDTVLNEWQWECKLLFFAYFYYYLLCYLFYVSNKISLYYCAMTHYMFCKGFICFMYKCLVRGNRTKLKKNWMWNLVCSITIDVTKGRGTQLTKDGFRLYKMKETLHSCIPDKQKCI